MFCDDGILITENKKVLSLIDRSHRLNRAGVTLSKKTKKDGTSVNGRIREIVTFLGLSYNILQDKILINDVWLPRMSCTKKMIQGVV